MSNIYEFFDIFKKTCTQNKCHKSRETKKCINGKCKIISMPNTKNDVLKHHYSQIGGNHLQLNHKNIDTYIKSNSPILILFSTSWCPYCINFLPIWNELIHKFKNTNISLAVFDCTLNKPPSKYNISSYPTLILFHNNKSTVFTETRTIPNLVSFIKTNISQSGGGKKSLKLISIKKSNLSDKKLMATFLIDNFKIKTVHFGSAFHQSYPEHKDPERRLRYIKRHKKNENWNNPITPGALSRWILWEKKSLKDSIQFFKKKFRL